MSVDRVPRASLAITLLDDEDFSLLLSTPGGAEAFGVFTTLLLVGRRRHQDGGASRIGDSDALKIDSSLTHVQTLAHVTEGQLDRCIKTMEGVAKATGGKPWMYVEKGRLVIRNFFKFNATGRGGNRQGAGRPRKVTPVQEAALPETAGKSKESNEPFDSFDSAHGNSSCAPSSSSSSSSSNPPTPRRGGEPPARSKRDDPDDPEDDRHFAAVQLVRELFPGNRPAIEAARDPFVAKSVADHFGRDWSCYLAAIRTARAKVDKGETVRDLHGFALKVGRGYLTTGIPPAAIRVAPRTRPEDEPVSLSPGFDEFRRRHALVMSGQRAGRAS